MKNKFNFKVELYDTDAMGVVWHGNYVRFCELGRCAFLRELNYTYNDMKNDGYAYPIVKMDFKFIKPAFFDDELNIEVELVEFESLLKFKYKITNQKGEVLCKARTSQAAVKIANQETCFYLPECLTEKLSKIR